MGRSGCLAVLVAALGCAVLVCALAGAPPPRALAPAAGCARFRAADAPTRRALVERQIVGLDERRHDVACLLGRVDVLERRFAGWCTAGAALDDETLALAFVRASRELCP